MDTEYMPTFADSMDIREQKERMRFYAACAAMNGMLVNAGYHASTESYASKSVEFADALLAELYP